MDEGEKKREKKMKKIYGGNESAEIKKGMKVRERREKDGRMKRVKRGTRAWKM